MYHIYLIKCCSNLILKIFIYLNQKSESNKLDVEFAIICSKTWSTVSKYVHLSKFLFHNLLAAEKLNYKLGQQNYKYKLFIL